LDKVNSLEQNINQTITFICQYAKSYTWRVTRKANKANLVQQRTDVSSLIYFITS